MSMIWSVVWGILTVLIMLVTIKYYLPHLAKRAETLCSDHPSDSDGATSEAEAFKKPEPLEHIEKAQKFSFQTHQSAGIILAVICGCFAGWCGYTASVFAVSMTGMLKMMISMFVLAGVLITDIEFLMIPNLYPVILLFARLPFIVTDFIWNDGDALLQLLDNVAALVISLVLLLIMSKITKNGLGMGDVKLFSALGFLCGIRAVIFTLLFSFILCALVSTVLLIIKKKHLKDALPMGPFIWLGYGVAILLTLI